MIEDVRKDIDAKSDQNQSLTDQRIETTWTLSIIGLIAAVAIGFLVARQTIINPMREFTTITNDIANSGDFSKRIKNPGRDEIGEAGKAVNNMLEVTERALKDIQELLQVFHRVILWQDCQRVIRETLKNARFISENHWNNCQ